MTELFSFIHIAVLFAIFPNPTSVMYRLNIVEVQERVLRYREAKKRWVEV